MELTPTISLVKPSAQDYENINDINTSLDRYDSYITVPKLKAITAINDPWTKLPTDTFYFRDTPTAAVPGSIYQLAYVILGKIMYCKLNASGNTKPTDALGTWSFQLPAFVTIDDTHTGVIDSVECGTCYFKTSSTTNREFVGKVIVANYMSKQMVFFNVAVNDSTLTNKVSTLPKAESVFSNNYVGTATWNLTATFTIPLK